MGMKNVVCDETGEIVNEKMRMPQEFLEKDTGKSMKRKYLTQTLWSQHRVGSVAEQAVVEDEAEGPFSKGQVVAQTECQGQI